MDSLHDAAHRFQISDFSLFSPLVPEGEE